MGGTGGSDVRRFTVALAVSLLVLPLAVHGTSRPEGWDDETHSRDAAADLRRVFAADRVNRLDIEITASDWQAAMATMAGAFGAQRAQGGGQGGGGAALPAPSPEAIAGCAGRVVGEARAVGPVTGERLSRGGAAEYMGLFTMTEIPGSPLLTALFGSDAGNLYKPVDTGGRWTQFFPLSFPKKTNGDDEDWTDISNAIAVLDESRANAATWRARLEARLEVSGFLRWLALNTIVGNFDASGGLSAHDYYLYGSPRHRDRLFWMAWDHDLAINGGGLCAGIGGGGGGTAGANAQAVMDLFLNGTAATWPLTRFCWTTRCIEAPIARMSPTY